MRKTHWIALTLALASLTGCSWANKVIYRIDINQGNYIDTAAVAQLKLGMNKEQVTYLLGPPMLVEEGFPNTWYYIQWLKSGHRKATQKDLILEFSPQGTLVEMKGDVLPNAGAVNPNTN